MTDAFAHDEIYDAIYEVVFDHLKPFWRRESGVGGDDGFEAQESDGLVEPFQIATDRIIRAKAIGEQNSLQNRNRIKAELDNIEALVSVLDKASFDEISRKILTVTAFNIQLDFDQIQRIENALESISKLIHEPKLSDTLIPVLGARRAELEDQNTKLGRRQIAPEVVAEECRVIWYEFTGKIESANFNKKGGADFGQHFPQFVEDIFKQLFKTEGKLPSVRTALQKSAEKALGRIQPEKFLHQ